ncbi:MAG: glycosyltransferase family protein [Dysgonamonadaceae bacterium]|jgi:GT2 family glycosyltransferase|nr:glycosyltransferase family protein [Dysgonamonadaceae bacterium]
MISIIICSKQGNIADELQANIRATIGVPYELIVIDNSDNRHSIFSAYNEGVRQATQEILCFMHEDIRYHSDDWGNHVIAHFSDSQTGMIGLAGAYCLLFVPSLWAKAKPHFKCLIQSFPDKNRPARHYRSSERPVELACVDGFWFCMRKSLFEHVSFDAGRFRHFHFYDMDISMQVRQQGYAIQGVTDILIEHFSTGSLDARWLEAAYLFHRKWEKELPASVNNSPRHKPLMRLKAYRDLLYLHRKNHFPVSSETRMIGWKTLGLNIATAYLLSLFKK